MALFKDFTFDGENSKDYGVYISGDAVYDAPERAVDMVQIPGRNGALALDNGYYKNIDVTYPAGCFAGDQADFAAKLSRIRNMLASRHRYCRLEDAYHPDHFRMALYKSGLDVAPVARNKAGRFNITFDAKPQRFLKSGEVIQELDADAPPTTSYGPADIVTFEGEPGDAIVHGQWPLEPIQDLHGYDSPWPAGGGANLWGGEKLANDIALKVEGAIKSTTNKTVTYEASKIHNVVLFDSFKPNTQYTVVLRGSGEANMKFVYTDSTEQVFTGAITNLRAFVSQPSKSVASLSGHWSTGTTVLNYEECGLFEGVITASDFTPYANICPISGYTGAEITDNGFNWLDIENKYASSYVSYSNGIVNNVIVDTRPFFQAAMLASVDGSTWVTIGFFNLTALTLGKHHFTFNSGKYNYVVFKHNGSTRDIYIFNRLRVVKNTSYCISFDLVSQDMSTVGGFALKELNINLSGDRDGEHEPFVGTTHDITWTDEAGTVYGGTLEYMGGDTWRLAKTMESVDLGTMPWAFVSPWGFQTYDTLSQAKLPPSDNDVADIICSNYKNVSANGVFGAIQNSIIALRSGGRIAIHDEATLSMTGAQFRVYVSGTQLVYELATPVVYDFTGAELATLIGTNNIFSNTGTTTITVQSPYELENPTLYPSKLLIRVYGSGTIQVNDITITVAEHSGYIDIDCDIMDCHRGADSMNQYVSFSGNDFPELQPGINRILLNGPDKVEITPRWWEL